LSAPPIRDPDAPTERTGQRSGRVLLLGVLIALLAGGGAAMLKQVVGPPSNARPENLVLPVDPDLAADGEALRERLLTQLIEDSRLEPDPTSLPAFQSFVLPCRRAGPTCSTTVERLSEDGVPWNLVREFAAALPSRADADADALLMPAFEGDDLVRAREALDVLRNRRRVLVGSATSCGCGFGLVPRDPAGEAWLLAFTADGQGGLAWQPEEIDGAWVLGVTSAEDGLPLLKQKISANQAPDIRVMAGGPQAGRRTLALPPKP
jgi:hypothetical protein